MTYKTLCNHLKDELESRNVFNFDDAEDRAGQILIPNKLIKTAIDFARKNEEELPLFSSHNKSVEESLTKFAIENNDSEGGYLVDIRAGALILELLNEEFAE